MKITLLFVLLAGVVAVSLGAPATPEGSEVEGAEPEVHVAPEEPDAGTKSKRQILLGYPSYYGAYPAAYYHSAYTYPSAYAYAYPSYYSGYPYSYHYHG